MRNQFRSMSLAMLGVAMVAVSACGDEDNVDRTDGGSFVDGGSTDARVDGPGGNTDTSASPDGPPTDTGGSAPDGGSVPTILALAGTANTSFLATFPANAPQTPSTPVVVKGLAPAEVLLSITVRPANGKVYGLGSTSRLYEIDRTTGDAMAIGAAAFTPALMGTYYGFDFNPVVDRIRLVSDAEQNLRLHPDTGVVAAMDPALNPAGSVGAVAYTNSSAGATATTLFGLDYAANSLVRIGGPDGMPKPDLGAMTVIGAVGSDIGEPASLDIAPSNMAYAAWQSATVSKLYMVNLTTGAASEVGTISGTTGAIMVRSIAVLP